MANPWEVVPSGGGILPTPGDTQTNPTTGAVYNEVWDETNSRWGRTRASSPSGVAVSPGGVLAAAMHFLRSDNYQLPVPSAIKGDAVALDGLPMAGVFSLFNGATLDRRRTPAIFKAFNALAIATETTIWTPAAGKKFRLMGYHLVSSVAGNILLRDNTAGTVIAVIPSAAGGFGSPIRIDNGILSATINNVLTAIGPAASTLSGIVFGTEE